MPERPPADREARLRIEIADLQSRLDRLKERKDNLVINEVDSIINAFARRPATSIVRKTLEASVAHDGFDPEYITTPPADPDENERWRNYLKEKYSASAIKNLQTNENSGIPDLEQKIGAAQEQLSNKKAELGEEDTGPEAITLPEIQKDQTKVRHDIDQLEGEQALKYWSYNKIPRMGRDPLKDSLKKEAEDKKDQVRPDEPGATERKGFIQSKLVFRKGAAAERGKVLGLQKKIDSSVAAEIEILMAEPDAERIVREVSGKFFETARNLAKVENKDWTDLTTEFEKKLAEIRSRINNGDPGFTAPEMAAQARRNKALLLADISQLRMGIDVAGKMKNEKNKQLLMAQLERKIGRDFDPTKPVDENEKRNYLWNAWAREKAWQEVKKGNGGWAMVDLVKMYEEQKIDLQDSFAESGELKLIRDQKKLDVDAAFSAPGVKEQICKDANVTLKGDKDKKARDTAFQNWKKKKEDELLKPDARYQSLKHLEDFRVRLLPNSPQFKETLAKITDPVRRKAMTESYLGDSIWTSLRDQEDFWVKMAELDDLEKEHQINKKKFEALALGDPETAETEKIEGGYRAYDAAKSEEQKVWMAQSELRQIIEAKKVSLENATGAELTRIGTRFEEYLEQFNLDETAADYQVIKGRYSEEWLLSEAERLLQSEKDAGFLALKSKIERLKNSVASYEGASGGYLPDIIDLTENGDLEDRESLKDIENVDDLNTLLETGANLGVAGATEREEAVKQYIDEQITLKGHELLQDDTFKESLEDEIDGFDEMDQPAQLAALLAKAKPIAKNELMKDGDELVSLGKFQKRLAELKQLYTDRKNKLEELKRKNDKANGRLTSSVIDGALQAEVLNFVEDLEDDWLAERSEFNTSLANLLATPEDTGALDETSTAIDGLQRLILENIDSIYLPDMQDQAINYRDLKDGQPLATLKRVFERSRLAKKIAEFQDVEDYISEMEIKAYGLKKMVDENGDLTALDSQTIHDEAKEGIIQEKRVRLAQEIKDILDQLL